jgi:hypothetical protein
VLGRASGTAATFSEFAVIAAKSAAKVVGILVAALYVFVQLALVRVEGSELPQLATLLA